MPSGMCFGPVVPGVCCPTTCRAGNWSTIISGFGGGKEPGSRFTMPSYLGPVKLEEWAKRIGGWRLEVVPRPVQQHTFQVLPRRWVVERTLAWLGRQRKLSKDYEVLPETTETWVYTAMTGLMLRRLARAPAF